MKAKLVRMILTYRAHQWRITCETLESASRQAAQHGDLIALVYYVNALAVHYASGETLFNRLLSAGLVS
jgi:hypothetical protein